ncbi:MAG: 5'-3' exonuclease H3TH domain-containing protein [Buchnera aphidicola (Schlechtendalia peitan)]
MTSRKNKVHYLLVDGTYYLYRSYYSFSFLKNKHNVSSGAIYGVINILKKFSFQYPKTHIIIIFDSPTKTFRHELFHSYKLNRHMMPTNLKLQIKPLYEIIKTMGFPILTIPNFEADDVIGTLAYEADKKGKITLISTNDKDLAQLVNTNINILEEKSGTILGNKEIEKKYGVVPRLIPDLFGLMGDKSDNIPGVLGIGKKTALVLLKYFGSIQNIYRNIHEITKSSFRGANNTYKKLIKNKKLAFVSKNLATIRTNVYINKSINELVMSKPSIYKLSNFFKYYEFYNFLKLLDKGTFLMNMNKF